MKSWASEDWLFEALFQEGRLGGLCIDFQPDACVLDIADARSLAKAIDRACDDIGEGVKAA